MIEGGASHAAIHLTSGMVASGTLTNHSTIKGGVHGLLSVSSITELTNSGRIVGMLRNSGTISGAFGVSSKAMADTEKLENSGMISGTTAGIAAGKGLGTLTNLAGRGIQGQRRQGGDGFRGGQLRLRRAGPELHLQRRCRDPLRLGIRPRDIWATWVYMGVLE